MIYHLISQEFSTRIGAAKVNLSCPNIYTLILFVELDEFKVSIVFAVMIHFNSVKYSKSVPEFIIKLIFWF